MAIDTSSLDKYRKDKKTASTSITDIDISAFGLEWDTSKPTTVEPAKEPVEFLGGATISAPKGDQLDAFGNIKSGQTRFLPRLIDTLRPLLPRGVSQPLFGSGVDYGFGKDTGFIQWALPGLAKEDIQRFEDRVESLVKPRLIDGIRVSIPKERANDIAWRKVTGQDLDDVTPLEQKIMRNVGLWEGAGSLLDGLNFIPFAGKILRIGAGTQLAKIAKLTDSLLIGKEIDVILPKLGAAERAALIKKLVPVTRVGDVERIVGEATVKFAKQLDAAAPGLKKISTGKTIAAGQAGKEITGVAAGAAGAADNVAPTFVNDARRTSASGRPLPRVGATDAPPAGLRPPVDTALPKNAPVLVTGQAVDLPVFRGTGDTKKILTRSGEGIMSNSAKYYAFTKEYAQNFGDKIEEAVVSLKKPFVIRNDNDLEAFRKLTGGKYLVWTWDDDTARVVAENARRRKALMDQGYDSLVIQIDPMSEARKTRSIFDDSQVIMLDGKTAKEVAKAAAPVAARVKTGDSLNRAIQADKARTSIQVGNAKPVMTNADVPPAVKVADKTLDVKGLNEMIRRDQISIGSTGVIGRRFQKGRDLVAEMTGNLTRLNEKIPDAEIVRLREMSLLGPETIDEIIARSRGIITDVQSVESAKLLRATIDDVIALPKGVALTKEQQKALEQVIAFQEKVVKDISNLIDYGGQASTPAERNLLNRLKGGFSEMNDHNLLNHALAEAVRKMRLAQMVEMGTRKESGRALQGLKKRAEGIDNRLRLLFQQINNNKKLSDLEKQAMIERVAKADINDDLEFTKLMEKLSTADFFDKFAEWSVAAKLWNPTTHAVNLSGNAVRQLIDMGIKSATNPLVAKADMMGALTGFRQGTKNAWRALTDDGYAAKLAKYIEVGGTSPSIPGRFGKYARTPFRFLAAGDEIFRTMGFQRKLHRDAYTMARKEGLRGKQLEARMNELLNVPTLKMLDDATLEGKRMTFQEDLGSFMSSLDTLRNPSMGKSAGDKAVRTGVRLFIPFLKTPTNLFKQSMDFSPIGYLKNGPELIRAIKRGDVEKAGTILGEATLGTALAAWIAIETLEGNVTGGAPSSKSEKDRFYRENKMPYAVKIGGVWYQYKRVDPFASVLGVASDMTTIYGETKPTELAGALVGVIAENLKDKTYLSGVSALMDALTGEDYERDFAVKGMILGAVLPSFIGHTARSIDPTVRVADTLGQRLMVQIPGFSDGFPAKVDVLGYDIERANKGLNYFFNPIQGETARIDPVTRGLMEINKTVALPQESFSLDTKKIGVKDGVSTKFSFNSSEYEDYAKFVGTALRNELDKMFRTDAYRRADDEDKIKMIDKARDEIQLKYKREFAKQKLGLEVDRAQQIRNIMDGKDPDAPAEPTTSEAIQSYFLGQ